MGGRGCELRRSRLPVRVLLSLTVERRRRRERREDASLLMNLRETGMINSHITVRLMLENQRYHLTFLMNPACLCVSAVKLKKETVIVIQCQPLT